MDPLPNVECSPPPAWLVRDVQPNRPCKQASDESDLHHLLQSNPSSTAAYGREDSFPKGLDPWHLALGNHYNYRFSGLRNWLAA